jgi:hypothetical protein
LKNNIGIYDVEITKLMLLTQIIYNCVENILKISKLTFAPHYEKERNWDSSIHVVVYDDNFSPCLPSAFD